MKKKVLLKGLNSALLAAAALYLIFESKAAVSAARQGILLCVWTVIPSLFPFFVLSRMAVPSPLCRGLSRVMAPVMKHLFHLPPDASLAVVLGAAGGYPTGAQTAAELYRQGLLSRDEAERLLSFCSNAGPGFIFGMLGSFFGIPAAWMLFAVHLVSAVLTGILFRAGKKPLGKRTGAAIPSVNLPSAMKASVSAMGSICGYVVLFRIICAGMEAGGLSLLPGSLSALIQGVLELTTGCLALKEGLTGPFILPLAAFFLSFGGVCVWLQTKSVLFESELTGRYYLPGKLIQGLISFLLSCVLFRLFPPVHTSAPAMPGNHHGLLSATGYIACGFLLIFLGIVLYSRKKAGKRNAGLV